MMLTHVDRKCVAQEGARLVIRMFSFSDSIAFSGRFFAEGSAEGICGSFLRKAFVKDFAAEGFRKDSGRFWAFGPVLSQFGTFLAECFCGRFCGRLLRKVRGRFVEGFPGR